MAMLQEKIASLRLGCVELRVVDVARERLRVWLGHDLRYC